MEPMEHGGDRPQFARMCAIAALAEKIMLAEIRAGRMRQSPTFSLVDYAIALATEADDAFMRLRTLGKALDEGQEGVAVDVLPS